MNNEQWLRERYEEIKSAEKKHYALVSIKIKRYRLITRLYGREAAAQVTEWIYAAVLGWLKDGEFLAHIHLGCYNALITFQQKNENTEIIKRFDELEQRIGETGDERFRGNLCCGYGVSFIKGNTDFEVAQYNADVCRSQSKENEQWSSHLEVYGQSFKDQDMVSDGLKLDIQKALEEKKIHMYLQPKVNLQNGRIESAEALVRWIEPGERMRSPASFLPILESMGTTDYIDFYIFEQACKTLERWNKNQQNRISLSVNLSRRTFGYPLFIQEFDKIYNNYCCRADCLEFELLESIVLNQVDRVSQSVKEIRKRGFLCALDDFGSGYSSYSVLTHSALSTVKIDRSLLGNKDNERERAVIKYIIKTAKELGMRIVAEGVEDPGYVDYLRELGCDYIQGYVFYKPMPVVEFEKRFVYGNEMVEL